MGATYWWAASMLPASKNGIRWVFTKQLVPCTRGDLVVGAPTSTSPGLPDTHAETEIADREGFSGHCDHPDAPIGHSLEGDYQAQLSRSRAKSSTSESGLRSGDGRRLTGHVARGCTRATDLGCDRFHRRVIGPQCLKNHLHRIRKHRGMMRSKSMSLDDLSSLVRCSSM